MTYNILFLHCNVVNMKTFGQEFKAVNYCTCIQLFFFILILIVNCSNKWTILINQTERVNPIAGHLTWHIFFSVFMKERNSNDLFFPCCPVVNLGGFFFFVLNFFSVAMLIFFTTTAIYILKWVSVSCELVVKNIFPEWQNFSMLLINKKASIDEIPL